MSTTSKDLARAQDAASSPQPRLRIAIGIATRGRPGILAETIGDLQHQTSPPTRILVAYADASDIGDAPRLFPSVIFLQTALGLTQQRNAILAEVIEEDIIVFLDDDFVLDPQYLAVMRDVFTTYPEVAVATGNLLVDGINGPGLTFQDAKAIVASNPRVPAKQEIVPQFNAYGCNMCLRMQPIRSYGLRFDTNLPLYGWYEDVDFSRQLAQHGTVVRVEEAYGAHLGAKSGRQSGVRLGYSQIANPVYLARKRSVSWSYALASMTSRSLKNLVRSVAPEPYVDRRGRLLGNLRGWRELIDGTVAPTRILHI